MSIDVYRLIAMGVNSSPSYEEAMNTGLIKVQNYGQGAFIRKWNHPDTKPSDVTINNFDDLPNYKIQTKKRLKKEGEVAGLLIWSLLTQADVNGGIESGNSTKVRKTTFRNNQKTEWARIKQALIDAVDKDAVDAIIPNWPTTPTP